MRARKKGNGLLKIIFFVGAILLFAGVAIFGLSKVKVDEFHKASVIFIVDSSASNAKEFPGLRLPAYRFRYATSRPPPSR